MKTIVLVILLAGCGGGDPGTLASPIATPVLRPATLAELVGPWQAAPLALPPELIARIDLACRAYVAPFPANVGVAVVDARGGGKVQVQYAGPNGSDVTCMDVTIGADGSVEVTAASGSGGGGPPPLLEPLALDSRGSISQGDDGRTTEQVAIGRVGSGIAQVVIVIPGQPPVVASLANGWYLAWTPGEWPPGTRIVAFDRTGQQVAAGDP